MRGTTLPFTKSSKNSDSRGHRHYASFSDERMSASAWLVSLEEARSCLTHRVYDQRAIQKKISCFAAGLRNQETAVARCPMQRSVIISGGRVVVSAYGISGTKALPFQSGLENANKPSCDLDETTQCALIACRGGVDQDPALNWLSWNTREHVKALFQCARRVTVPSIRCCLRRSAGGGGQSKASAATPAKSNRRTFMARSIRVRSLPEKMGARRRLISVGNVGTLVSALLKSPKYKIGYSNFITTLLSNIATHSTNVLVAESIGKANQVAIGLRNVHTEILCEVPLRYISDEWQ